MEKYKLHTPVSFLQTRSAIGQEMRKWGVTDWLLEKFGDSVKLSYTLRGQTIDLVMDKQAEAKDNARVLFLAVQALRMNEVREINDVVGSAYLQLNSPKQEKNPYDVLGLPRGTAKAVCEAQYKELAKNYHPDNKETGSQLQMNEINLAIQVIRKESV